MNFRALDKEFDLILMAPGVTQELLSPLPRTFSAMLLAGNETPHDA